MTCSPRQRRGSLRDPLPPGPFPAPRVDRLGPRRHRRPVHGHQLGRFFHGYYKEYCYLPLYIFCGDHLLCARLRPADIDGRAGALKHLQRIIGQIRQSWPAVKILVRGDSGFCREPIMAWCEAHGVDYLFGLAQNKRLLS